MKSIRFADMTLCAAGEQGRALSFREKLELARELEKLGTDLICVPPIRDEKSDALLIRTVAGFVEEGILCCPVGDTRESVEAAWRALSGAKHPRLLVSLPLSPVQMEYLCQLKPEALLERERLLVSAAVKCGCQVEFAALDATRAEFDFLCRALETAISAGATVITLCDSAGDMLPEEFAALLTRLRAALPGLANVTLGVQCSDALHMAAACAFACAAAGAQEIRTCVSGGSAPSLEAMGSILRARGLSLGLSARLDMTNLHRSAERMRAITDTRRTETSAFDNRMGEAPPPEIQGLLLEEGASQSELDAALRRMGYELSPEDAAQVYEHFCRIARKKPVGPRELDAIVAVAALQVPPTYRLISYVINCGNVISATAHIRMERDGILRTGLVTGDGPIDAAFLAIEQIVGRHYELDDFQIQAVTEGREAMGSTLVKLRSGGRLYSGQGVSTDVLGASIRAYVDALNKIAYEEKVQ